jgi:acetaldehyde dehydrogenase/alcohol dehydrogenase
MDIRKRIYRFPKMGIKAQFVAIPTTSGTGSEVTPFAVVTDETTGYKYPIADYELMPNMAIIDANFVMSLPKSITAAGGLDAITHSIEAYVSILASEFTDGQALQALRLLKQHLPAAYEEGFANPHARERVHSAATIAGIAFANAFLGVCHSLAHKLGAAFHLPHGVANALLLSNVIRYNANDNPTKLAAFSQYDRPKAKCRYAEIAASLGLAGETNEEKVASLIAWFDALKHQLGVPASIHEMGITEADFLAKIDAIALDAFDDQCTGANPRYPLIDELKAILLDSYYGHSFVELYAREHAIEHDPALSLS